MQIIETLRSLLPAMSPRSREFAGSLVAQYDQKGTLSERQWPWVFKLVEEQEAKAKAPPTPSFGDIGAIKSVFEAARERGWNTDLGLRFMGPNREKVKINPAKAHSANPGCYYVKVDDEYAGKITPQGEFHSPRSASHLAETARTAVATYLKDPTLAATAYGMAFCSCCFCGRKLDTAESRHVGYGPICADRFGLPWGARGPKEVRAVDARELRGSET